jgi:short-subunit dehydrogenase
VSKNKIDRLSGLCVVTGASSGIGLELARRAAKDGCEMILVARGDLSAGEAACREAGASSVQAITADLATREGIMALMDAIGDRPVAALFANAGSGEGGAFLDLKWGEIAHVIHTNITGTVALIHMIGQRMRERNEGRILVTGSIVGDMPGAFNLTYNSTKAFIDDFCVGLAEELKDTNIVISCLLPGATDTPFFAKADMEDTQVGRANKADPAKVAADGYDALLDGDAKVVSGFLNKVQYLFADILPDELVAKMHRRMAESDRHKKSETA